MPSYVRKTEEDPAGLSRARTAPDGFGQHSYDTGIKREDHYGERLRRQSAERQEIWSRVFASELPFLPNGKPMPVRHPRERRPLAPNLLITV